MFSIGGVQLNPSMVWEDQYVSSQVEQTVRRTLQGRMVAFSGPLVGGRNATFSGGDDHGWLTVATLNSLLSLAAVPGAIYTMVRGEESYSVMFRHNDPPAVDMRMLIPRTAVAGTDYVAGTIKLIIL